MRIVCAYFACTYNDEEGYCSAPVVDIQPSGIMVKGVSMATCRTCFVEVTE